MPLEAVADLVERLVDRLDQAEPDLDLELEEDCCPASDDGNPLRLGGWLGIGDESDAEPNGDEDEPDDDRAGDDDEPDFRRNPRVLIRPEPFVQIAEAEGHRRHGVDGVWVAVR